MISKSMMAGKAGRFDMALRLCFLVCVDESFTQVY